MARYFSSSELNSLSYIHSSEYQIKSGKFPKRVNFDSVQPWNFWHDKFQSMLKEEAESSSLRFQKKADWKDRQIGMWESDIAFLQEKRKKLSKVAFQLSESWKHGRIYEKMSGDIFSQVHELDSQIDEICEYISKLEEERDYLLSCSREQERYQDYLSNWYQLLDK